MPWLVSVLLRLTWLLGRIAILRLSLLIAGRAVGVVASFLGAFSFEGFIVVLLAAAFVLGAIWAALLGTIWGTYKSLRLPNKKRRADLVTKIENCLATGSAPPRFALYLRSFETQKTQLVLGNTSWAYDFSLTMDESLALSFGTSLPLLGLEGVTGERLHGVAEMRVSSAEWRSVVDRLWSLAEIVILVPGRTSGILEEIALASADGDRRSKAVIWQPNCNSDMAELEWQLARTRGRTLGVKLRRFCPGEVRALSGGIDIPFVFSGSKQAMIRALAAER